MKVKLKNHMTPEEIDQKHKLITQAASTALAMYLDAWMKNCKQPTKNLAELIKAMEKDGCAPSFQVQQTLATITDWFAFGN